jgi:hypothetical protein
VLQIVQVVKDFALRRVSVETNGIGGFAPTVLKAALKQAKIHDCGVSEINNTANKNKRILEALEDPLASGTLWAHTSVLYAADGPGLRPDAGLEPGDHRPAGRRHRLPGRRRERDARADRPGRGLDYAGTQGRDDWRPSAGVHEVELEG